MDENIINLSLDDKSKATVHLFGATITSFVVDKKEILFVSKNSIFDGKKAIRGGIPVVFPNFGPWESGPQHGFARTMFWKVKKPLIENSEFCALTLSLTENEESKKIWDYKFELEYSITLYKNCLKTELIIHNKDKKEFDFTTLLHTYLKLDNIYNAKISDLENCYYLDKIRNDIIEKEIRKLVEIDSETDRIYYSTPSQHTVFTGNSNKLIVMLKKENLPDTVVWNPWENKAMNMTDFGDDEYKNMICVESGLIQNRYFLEANKSFKVAQEIIALQEAY